MRFKFIFCFLLLLSTQSFAYGPWGKDADLSLRKGVVRVRPKSLNARGISSSIIKFHQKTLSQADGPRSHFRPTSSQYMLDAVQKYGFFKGYIMGCDRLLRENNEEWVYEVRDAGGGYTFKYDPVR